MAAPYNPQNWFWFVGGDQSQVYSSARGDFVPVSDAAYLAWLGDGATAGQIDTTDNLGAVLAPYPARPVNPAVLAGYQGALADAVLSQINFKLIFNHENRLRAIERQLGLNGSPANLAPAQARNFLKSQL